MSKFETGEEEAAYDRGFEVSKDYWIPKAQEMLVEAILKDWELLGSLKPEQVAHVIRVIEDFDHEQDR